MHATIRLRPCASASTAARALVRKTCSGLPEGLIEDTALVAGVLVTHSVRHARTALHVRVEISGSAVLVCVDDGASDLPPFTRKSVAPGYGLDLVARLAQRCGFVRTETGRQAWALLDGTRRPDLVGTRNRIRAAA